MRNRMIFSNIILLLLLWSSVLGAVQQYTCPMHPHYIAQSEGTCPICGMALVQLESGLPLPNSADSGTRRSVTISPETIQNIGVRVQAAETIRFGREVRSYGLIAVNSRLQSVVTGRVEGWIEKLAIRAIGDPVHTGMLLFYLYSPELIAAQRDLLSALKETSTQRIQAAERRLRSLGVGDMALKLLREKRKIMEQVPFYADSDGLVSELSLQQGAYIRPGTLITRIQNYDRVWLNASVPEKDLALLQLQGRAVVTFPNLAGESIESKIDYIDPVIDSKSRTGQVRLVLDNRERLLRPGSYADIIFHVDEQQRLAVADEALLMDAHGSHLLVSMGEGRFEARTVTTGLSSGGYTEIRAGVAVGEPVVISGQFLLDSESSLRESFTKLKRLKTPFSLLILSSTELSMVDHLIDAALYMHEALIDGYDLQADMLQASRDIKAPLMGRFGDTQLALLLEETDRALFEAMTARSMSANLKALNDLVTALEEWVVRGKPEHYQQKGVFLFRDKISERLWLQPDSDPRNPYNEDGEAMALNLPVVTQPQVVDGE